MVNSLKDGNYSVVFSKKLINWFKSRYKGNIENEPDIFLFLKCVIHSDR